MGRHLIPLTPPIRFIIGAMNIIAQLQQQIAEFKTQLIQKDLELAQKDARISYLYEQFICKRPVIYT